MKRARRVRREHIAVKKPVKAGVFSMIGRISAAAVAALILAQIPARVFAQDIPGIEICMVEKTMERRTYCRESKVDFQQKSVSKLPLDHRQKIDGANRQIGALNVVVAGLQKVIVDL